MCIVLWMLQCGDLDIFTNVILVYHFPITIFKTCMYWDQGWIVPPRVCVKCRHHTRITRQFFLPSLVMCCLYVGSIKIKMCNQSKYNEVLHYSTKLYRSLQLTYSFPIASVLYVLFQVDYGCGSQAELEIAVLPPSKSWPLDITISYPWKYRPAIFGLSEQSVTISALPPLCLQNN